MLKFWTVGGIREIGKKLENLKRHLVVPPLAVKPAQMNENGTKRGTCNCPSKRIKYFDCEIRIIGEIWLILTDWTRKASKRGVMTSGRVD